MILTTVSLAILKKMESSGNSNEIKTKSTTKSMTVGFNLSGDKSKNPPEKVVKFKLNTTGFYNPNSDLKSCSSLNKSSSKTFILNSLSNSHMIREKDTLKNPITQKSTLTQTGGSKTALLKSHN